MQTSAATWEIEYPHKKIGKFIFISNGLAINWRHLINHHSTIFCFIHKQAFQSFFLLNRQQSLEAWNRNTLYYQYKLS